MKSILTMFAGTLLVTSVFARVCDQNYHMQAATQFILEGDSPSTLVQKGTALALNKSMNNATILSSITEYRLMTDFAAAGTCSEYVSNKVGYALKRKTDAGFSPDQKDYFLKINDGEYVYKKPGWDEYWFGIANKSGDTVILYDAVGKKKNEPQMFLWYGNASLKRTYKTVSGTGAVKVDSILNQAYTELLSWPDSASLIEVLLQDWKKYVKSESLDILQTVQLIKITYDSMDTPVANRKINRTPSAASFQARQTDQSVVIQTGMNRDQVAEPLSLFGMMGNKIATLHPTGYVYQWNGKTAYGTDAPTGVYFVQAGNRTLGKFFYSR